MEDAQAEAGPSRPRITHHELHHLEPEIIVIGAGIAGTALSYSLSHAGRKVLLLERDLSEPDRIVGELLQPGGVKALSKIGLEDVLNGIDAVPVEGYCCTTGLGGTRQVGVPYPALEAMIRGDDVKRTRKDSGEVDRAGLEEVKMNGNRGGKHDEDFDGDGTEHSNGHSNGHANGYSNGDAQELRKRKATTNGSANGNGHAPPVDHWHVESSSGLKEGRSFHHGRLIQALRRRCIEDAPNLTVLEGTVRDLIYCDHSHHVIGVKAAFKPDVLDGPSTPGIEGNVSEEGDRIERNIYAPLTIIADGCFSKFRNTKGAKIPKAKTRSNFVGLILKDVDLPVPRRGTVCLTPAGPVLLYQIADKGRETRMLVDVKGKLPNPADGSLRAYILDNYLPSLPENLHEAVITAFDTQRPKKMPNSFLPPSMQGLSSPDSLRGAVLVGDAYNMRHPLTGGGMTVAFNDAVLLTPMLAPGGTLGLKAGREGLEDWDTIAEGLREWWWKRKNLAGVVNVLSMALYDLFGGADQPEFEVLREGCIQYFELGGECLAGPVGLLSALTPKPLMLFYHFFAVAFYSIWILLAQGSPSSPGEVSHKPGWLEVPQLLVFSVKVFWAACVVLLPVIWTEFKI